MLHAIRQPRWMVATVVVVVLAAVFVRLGFWQLSRLEERRLSNTVGQERLDSDPVDLRLALEEAGDDLESLEYRRVFVAGEYDTSEEVLIRSQVELGQAGFHVITPLVTDDGSAVLVNRGWVPLTMDTPPVDSSPETGSQEVEGWVHLTETRPPLGAEEPPGAQDVFNRVDIDRMSEQMSYDLTQVYIAAIGEGSGELPVPVDPPDFSDEGPHLAYAIQWFAFAAVGLIGFYFLLRRRGGQST